MVRLLALVFVCAPAIAVAGKAYNDGSGGSWDCSKDANVAININDGTFTFTGACKIAINGNGNTIAVDGATSITANGNNNTVNYGKTKPKIADNGNGNKFNAGGAKVDKKSAGDSGAIDCKKSPTYRHDATGGDSLKFIGTCDEIEVSTGDNNLQIENVKKLVLNGGGNNVSINGVDAIVTDGADNKVTYKKGLSGAKPKISGAGADNKVVQVK